MDSQLASVLTSGSLDVQNGSRSAEGSGPVSDPVLEPEDQTSPCPAAGNLQPVRAALTSRPDAPSINGRKPEVGGTSEPASQETSKIGGFRQPITVKPGVPVLRSQPIRIKIVVPPRCKRPITNSAISLTKDFAGSHLRRPLLLSADKRRSKIHLNAVKDEAQVMEVTYQKNGAEETERKNKERDILDVKIVHFDRSEAVKILSQQRIKEENAEREIERNIPLILDLKSCFEEEQTEPLDLSLPKKKESRERRCSGRFLEDSGAESSLIMEVDEYEGDGDRDVVEEDDDQDSLRPPSSFFSTSSECDTQNLLLIDDQGIPYTLSPDGLKVPQVDASTSEDSAEPEAKPSTPAGPSCSQSSENALNTPLEEFPSSPAPPPASPPGGTKQEDAPDVPADPAEAVEAVHPPPPPSSQNIQILSNPPAGAPILLLSSQLSSPLQVASPGASTPMLLLLSSVPSSSGESASTPIAVLDPATGQLSQITAASAPVSLPLASPLASPLPHPVIRLSPNNPPVVLNNPVLSIPERQVGYAESNPGTEAMSAEDDENKPLSFPAPPPPPTGSDRAQSPPEEVQSPLSDSRLDPADLPSEHLPLDDHLYFSSSAAPPSPPIGPLFPSGKLDPLDPLDPLSPASPGTVGSRRVLYCQLCPRVFFYLSDLERHAITHSQKKPHVCQQCGKAFKRSSHLQRHKHIHTGQRNFVCPICAKRFREAGELQRHQRVHTGEKPYQCQLCHTRFAERNTLRRHTKRKHPYHQVAMEMLNERRDRGGGGGSAVQDEEESAEWYNSTVSNLENSESETET